jgi:hypothetical protein
LAGRIEKSAAISGENPGAFAADGDWQVLAKIPGKNS